MTKLTTGERAAYAGILLLALALRLHVALGLDYQAHPDEVCDYLDRGFRIVYGYGCDPWTYQHGLRSYLFPGIIAAVIRLFSWGPTPSPDVYIGAVHGFMALLSMSLVVCAIVWGRRTGGLVGGVVAGFVVAIWFELLYYGPHTLAEVMATNFLVVGMCLYRDEQDEAPGAWRVVAIGLLLGLAVAIRLQLAPGVAVVLIWLGWRHGWRHMLWAGMAAAVPVVATGMLDWATFRYPFQSFIMYIYATMSPEMSRFFPTEPLHYYLNVENHYILGLFPALAVGVLFGGRRLKLLLAVLAAIVLSHSVIGLKLPRYMYPAMPLALVLASVAATEALGKLSAGLARAGRVGAVAMLLAVVGASSWSLAREGPFSRNWLRMSGTFAATRVIAAMPDVCGIGAYRTGAAAYPGFSRIRHDVKVYMISKPERFAADAVSFNVMMAMDDDPPPDGPFTRVKCWDNGHNEGSYNRRQPGICLWTRPGTCQPGAIADPDPDRPPGW